MNAISFHEIDVEDVDLGHKYAAIYAAVRKLAPGKAVVIPRWKDISTSLPTTMASKFRDDEAIKVIQRNGNLLIIRERTAK